MTKIAKAPANVDVLKLVSYKAQGAALVEFLEGQPCTNAAQETWFSEQLSAVRGLIKGLEDERTSVTKPMLEAKRHVDELFAPATAPLKRCEVVIRGKLADVARMRFQADADARRLAADAAAQGDHLGAMAALAEAPDAIRTLGSSARATWIAAVRDFRLVPDEFKVINDRALAQAAKGSDGEPAPIPGIEWVLDATVRAK